MATKFIKRLDSWAIQFRQKLWTKSDVATSKIINPRVNYIHRVILIITFCTILIFSILLVVEYIRGDYPIYGSAKIGAVCKDGWVSYSTGSGTCSHHGGVARWIYPQIGFHYCNPLPYGLTILTTFEILLLISLFSFPFRQRFIACLAEVGYHITYLICSCFLFIVVLIVTLLPPSILFFLYKYWFTN